MTISGLILIFGRTLLEDRVQKKNKIDCFIPQSIASIVMPSHQYNCLSLALFNQDGSVQLPASLGFFCQMRFV